MTMIRLLSDISVDHDDDKALKRSIYLLTMTIIRHLSDNKALKIPIELSYPAVD
jgi:hypothetical protein